MCDDENISTLFQIVPLHSVPTQSGWNGKVKTILLSFLCKLKKRLLFTRLYKSNNLALHTRSERYWINLALCNYIYYLIIVSWWSFHWKAFKQKINWCCLYGLFVPFRSTGIEGAGIAVSLSTVDMRYSFESLYRRKDLIFLNDSFELIFNHF